MIKDDCNKKRSGGIWALGMVIEAEIEVGHCMIRGYAQTNYPNVKIYGK